MKDFIKATVSYKTHPNSDTMKTVETLINPSHVIAVVKDGNSYSLKLNAEFRQSFGGEIIVEYKPTKEELASF